MLDDDAMTEDLPIDDLLSRALARLDGSEVAAATVEAGVPGTVSVHNAASIVGHDNITPFLALIARGVEGTPSSVEQVVEAIRAGEAHLWPGERSVIVTDIKTLKDGRRAMNVWLAAGDMDEIVSMIPGLKAVGRAMGCTLALSEGRKGWEKVLAPAGWSPWSVTMWVSL